MRERPDWLPRDIVNPANSGEREAVRFAQRVLRMPSTGEMDERTVTALRGIQIRFKITPTGILDAQTGRLLDRLRPRSEEGS